MVYVASKLFGVLVSPGNLLLLLGLAGVILQIAGRRRLGTVAVGIALGTLAAIAVLPVGPWLIDPLERRFPVTALPDHVDGIVILGGAVVPMATDVTGVPEVNDAADRMIAGMALARARPSARVVFTGGAPQLLDEVGSEATLAETILLSLGLSPDRLILESESRNTWENAVYTHRLVAPRPGEVWVLVTSASHMPRSVGCFRAVGWTVVPHPVDFLGPGRTPRLLTFDLDDNLQIVERAVKEWVGLVAYHLLGRTTSLLPSP